MGRTAFRYLLVGVLGFVLGGAGGIFAVGTIPDANGVIHACYRVSDNDKDDKGELRLVRDPTSCKKNERAISWNQRGPQGPTEPPTAKLALTAPASATAGTAFSATVTAQDAGGNTTSAYRGTVHFTSSDTQAVLPSDITFTAADAGVRTVSITLKTAGTRTITVTDTMTPTITGSASVTANPAVSSLLGISSTPDRTFVTDGVVNAIVRLGDTVYLGGAFRQVGPRTGPGVGIAAASGLDAGLPEVSGGASVLAVAPDGTGGWYVGGAFKRIGGVARNNLAHIRADKSVDPSFTPDVGGEVQALAVSGDTLYMGGFFASVGGQTRTRLAAVDRATGALKAWNPSLYQFTGAVHALAVSGGTVYVGCSCTFLNGAQFRDWANALDATTAAWKDWNPSPDNPVHALAVSGSTVYAGGPFSSIGGTTRRGIAALDAVTGAALASWSANAAWQTTSPGWANALALSGATLYVGGFFNSIGGQTRTHLAALDTATGAVKAWNPSASQTVFALAVSGSTVYAGGFFTSVGGQDRNRIAALDATTGAATTWDPNANNAVLALAATTDAVYAGGFFTSIGGQARRNLAALTAASGSLTGWDPSPSGIIHALSVSADTVYAGGEFTSIGGKIRNRIAALSPADGTATSWDPDANGVVRTLTVSGPLVYAGGDFGTIGGRSRAFLAALEIAGFGFATAWDPNPNGIVRALAVSGSTVYAGGSFAQVGPPDARKPRSSIAAFDAATGLATPWDPNPDGVVHALALSGASLYAGGSFGSIGGQFRGGIAALDVVSGGATPWNPNANGRVQALAVSGSTVFAGGFFSSIGGQARNHLAALDAATGAATAWDPNPRPPVTGNPGDPVVRALAVSSSSLYVGGTFEGMEFATQQGFAAFTEPASAAGATP